MTAVTEVEIVVAHADRATLRVGEVFLKVDADGSKTAIEIEAMARAPIPTPRVLWHNPPVLALDALPGAPLGEVVCLDSYADVPALVTIGVQDGSVRRIPLPDGWFPFGIESDGDSVYILEGNPEDSESVLQGGNKDALADAWSLPVPTFALWEGLGGTLIHVDDERGAVTVGEDAQFFDPQTGSVDAGLELRSATSVVDAESGVEVWQLKDPYATDLIVGDTRYAQNQTSITAADVDTGDVAWSWPVPTEADGFTASGTIVETASGVYFSTSDSIVQLVPGGN